MSVPFGDISRGKNPGGRDQLRPDWEVFMRSSRKLSLLASAVGVLAPAFVSMVGVASAADETFTATTAITLPAGKKIQSFDISFVDPKLELYVLGDRTNASIDVVDVESHAVRLITPTGADKFAGATGNNNTSGPDGVIIIGDQVWAGDGDSTVKIFNVLTGAHIFTVHTGAPTDFRADELCFDRRDKLVMVANNAATPPFATIISTEDFSIKAKINFDGTNGAPSSNNGAEQCQWSKRTGKFYISIPGIDPFTDGTGGVAVIDPKTGKVETTFVIPLADCNAPQGMAVGPDHQILLGCNGANATASTAIIDERDGHTIKAFANESGSDEVWFNPGDNHYFLARSSAVGPNQLLGVIDAESLTADASAVTNAAGKGNVHSVAADPEHNQVFVPIPGTATAGVCENAGGVAGQGCIAVFTTPHDDKCFAEGSPVIRVSEDGDDDHMRESCHRHDHD